jgi:hypothetical protein
MMSIRNLDSELKKLLEELKKIFYEWAKLNDCEGYFDIFIERTLSHNLAILTQSANAADQIAKLTRIKALLMRFTKLTTQLLQQVQMAMHSLDTAAGYISLTLLPIDMPEHLTPPDGEIEVPELSITKQNKTSTEQTGLDDIFE